MGHTIFTPDWYLAGIELIFHLLDDFLTIDYPSATAERTMPILTMIFNRLRIPISPKDRGPTLQLQYLGIILDTNPMEGRLPLDKLDRIREILCQFESKQSVSKRALLSLLGHLNFTSMVIKPGRSFVSYLLALAASVKELHHHVRLNVECRLDLVMWLRFLTGRNGVALFLDKEVTKAADYMPYTQMHQRL